MEDMVSPVFGSAGPALTKGVDLDEVFSGGTGNLGLGATAGGQSAAPAAASSGGAGAKATRQKPSRGIGIGIGVAAGAATAHRGMKRELSDSNLGGAAGWDGDDSGWAGMGGDARRSMSEQQKLERRERNREHAKRSRIRKKFMLECLQEQLLAMRKQNLALRQVVKEHMPDEAATVFEKCINEKALVLSGKSTESAQPILSDDEDETKEPNCLLLEPDFQLMQALMASQQNFTISDPSMPDNPIVYASQGFLTLTGYTIQNVIGRNCRFLQGPGTDPRAIDIIRRGVLEGRDTSVCLMNYKADGTPFWNQFFVAALRDDTGKIVNFVGVQGEVQEEAQDREFRERLRKIPLPDELMRDDNDDAGDEINRGGGGLSEGYSSGMHSHHGSGASQCVCVLSVLAQVLLIGSLTLFWLQLWLRGWINAGNNNGSLGEAAVELDSGAASASNVDIMESFFRLSLALYEGRHNTSEPWSTQDGTGGYLEAVQVVKVPQAGNRQLGVLAKRLVGCNATSSSSVNCSAAVINGVSACQIPRDPPGCPKVLDRTILENEMVLSLSQMRSPVERLMSAFLSGAHSPSCALSSQTKDEVQDCFTAMAQTQAFRNIAGRLYSGHYAYADVHICHTSGKRKRVQHIPERTGRGGDNVEDGTSKCGETLGSTLAGLCLFNHIALTEAPGASALLLLETLPWIRPDRRFFDLAVPLAWPSKGVRGNPDQDTFPTKREVSRQGNHNPDKLQYITQDLRDIASASNQVDEMLYDIVSAKMCSRLSHMNLLGHPAVEAELAACPLGERCASKEWYEGIINSTKDMIETHSKGNRRCRLFQPLTRPPLV
eukprot:g2108.t2